MAASSPYSSQKIFHHREWIDAMRAGSSPAPIFVEIIPTNRCNQGCRFCAYRSPGYSSSEAFDVRNEIPIDKLLEIVADCEAMGVRAIELTGGGEPTLHPQFHDLCREILDADIDLGLVTNGSRWTGETTELLSRAKWVRFSIDAGNSETYARLRRVKASIYDDVRDAIRHLSEAKQPGSELVIGVGFVVTADNWRETYDAAQAAFDDGADNIRLSAVFQNAGPEYFAEFGSEAAALCEKTVCRFDSPDFRVFNLFADRLSDLRQGKPTYSFCGFQYASTYIGADLNAYRCCVLAYNSAGLLGSIRHQRFSELWAGSSGNRDSFDARDCRHCMFNKKNETIAYAIDPTPLHANFI